MTVDCTFTYYLATNFDGSDLIKVNLNGKRPIPNCNMSMFLQFWKYIYLLYNLSNFYESQSMGTWLKSTLINQQNRLKHE